MSNPYSNLKIFHHAVILDSIEQGNAVAPVYIRLKPTNICNHHCAYCTYGSGNTNQKTDNRNMIDHGDMIPWGKMQEIIGDMSEMGVKAVTLSGGGEPLTYPFITETFRLFRNKGIELSLISNGELLEGKVAEELYAAKWVRISFDSPDEKEYSMLRGLQPADFQRVVRNIESFARMKDTNCVLGVNYVVNKANYKRVYQAAEYLKFLGVDNVKYAAVVENETKYHNDIKDIVIEQIHRAQSKLMDERFQIINNYEKDWQDKNFEYQPFDACYTCRLITVIAADQKVYLCHTRAYDSDAVVGDLKDVRFKDLWFSEKTQKRLCGINPSKECRNFCAYEDRNQTIQAYFDVNLDHVNFI